MKEQQPVQEKNPADGRSDSNTGLGWQPIETAPKGRRILVWSGQEFYAAHWAKNPYTDDEAWITAEWGANNDRQQALVKPILWHEPPTMPNVKVRDRPLLGDPLP